MNKIYNLEYSVYKKEKQPNKAAFKNTIARTQKTEQSEIQGGTKKVKPSVY